ncbi:hypothetical protein RSOLAG1IB_09712 [Rhizoctonia solani AG-1 IB]|uniref:Uncharacterized protein n=1 Tax=Thanatephorus cucumeris (strain AG1-IB / isolate 7/3/14) TaxID=1108050 RepID=A0A0B7FS74_THACB|nr:hypothetical protein RSOLAG1IB_09712 [Rhizoctonia solani AG-1 IB]
MNITTSLVANEPISSGRSSDRSDQHSGLSSTSTTYRSPLHPRILRIIHHSRPSCLSILSPVSTLDLLPTRLARDEGQNGTSENDRHDGFLIRAYNMWSGNSLGPKQDGNMQSSKTTPESIVLGLKPAERSLVRLSSIRSILICLHAALLLA